MRLQDKVAIVTGGASGIGRAICLGYAKEGASVVIADINEAGAEAVAKEIKAAGGNALAVKTDVSEEADVLNVVKQTLDTYKKLDILVNSAGILEPVSLIDSTIEDWDKTMAVNLKGVFLCVREACRFMADNGGGKIINITSNAAFRGRASQQAYCASKGGLRGLTGNVAVQMGEYGIKINNLSPGWIDKTGSPELPDTDAKYQEYRIAATPLQRLGTPEDLVGPAIFLASSDSDFVTGTTLVVDGGASVELSGIGGHIKVDY